MTCRQVSNKNVLCASPKQRFITLHKKSRLTQIPSLIYHDGMIETLFFVFGLGFSVLVYFLSIKRRNISPAAKAGYFLLTLIGITGMVFLIGVAIADRIRSL